MSTKTRSRLGGDRNKRFPDPVAKFIDRAGLSGPAESECVDDLSDLACLGQAKRCLDAWEWVIRYCCLVAAAQYSARKNKSTLRWGKLEEQVFGVLAKPSLGSLTDLLKKLIRNSGPDLDDGYCLAGIDLEQSIGLAPPLRSLAPWGASMQVSPLRKGLIWEVSSTTWLLSATVSPTTC
jgi:hypothetical protein